MDSITQIVLGAACGEAALGKKIGNKALLFGAIGGTIPDLDVFTSRWIYNNEIDIMSAHRGFSHSIVFAILGAFLFGWLTHKLYDWGKRKSQTRIKDWIWLFFLALITHILLDSFTPYGTQIFQPFSNFRFATNNISVADPSYTVPFLLCIIVLMFFKRRSYRRRLWLKLAFGISSLYMLLTIGNKIYINSVFAKSLVNDNIPYIKFQTQPTILNNVLWYGIAETENEYYAGFYSILDNSTKVEEWEIIPKNHDLADSDHEDIKTLAWFSHGYYNFHPIEDSTNLQYNDLRYLMIDQNEERSYVFSFSIYMDGERYNAEPFVGQPPSEDDLRYFFKRIKGIK
ncbi:MAG: metal-dependent hydrolase [Flavobacteriaceae bacterium]|nr:metal-dependent hydrolase [Flavobacteriaceae bacterium]